MKVKHDFRRSAYESTQESMPVAGTELRRCSGLQDPMRDDEASF